MNVSDTQDNEYRIIVGRCENTDTSGYFTDAFARSGKCRFLKIEVIGCSDSGAFPCL